MTSGWFRLVVYVSRPVAPQLAVAALMGIAAAASSIGLIATSAWLISRAATHPPILHLMIAIVTVRVFGLSRGLCRYVERLIGHDAALRVLANLRVITYRHLVRLSPGGLSEHRKGDLVQSIVSDVDTALDVLIRVFLPYTVALGVAVGSVAMVTTFVPLAGLTLAVALVILAIGIPLIQSSATAKADGRLSPLRGELTTETIDLLHGLADLTAYDGIQKRLHQIFDTDNRLRVASARSSTTSGISAAVTFALAGCCLIVGLLSGVAAVQDGSIPGEVLSVVVLTPLAVFESISGLPVAAQRLSMARVALTRIVSIIASPDPTPEPLPGCVLPRDDVDSVRLQDVHASWRSDRPALRGVSMTIESGRRIAIVGASGSGKTTSAAVLIRFLDPYEGSATIDGIDIRTLPSGIIRGVIRLCDDEAYLFDSTIEANIRIGSPFATVGQLREALAAARLLNWVDTLPQGLATPIGEHGLRLSGGQRRRLALARAFVGEASVLVLDEPTEHLDDQTAQAILIDLLDATSRRTVILLTHRETGLEGLDEIIKLDNGRIVSRRAISPFFPPI